MSNIDNTASRAPLQPVIADNNNSQPLWNNIPEGLRERAQWCLARPTEKRPLQADGRPASSTDPSTWTDFDTACRVAKEKGWHIGYMLSADDPYTCIDLDVKPDTPQERKDEFLSLIDYFDSYAEHSRSGLGYHAWVKGKVPQGYKRDGIEVYADKRFMICTGNVVSFKPIRERQRILDTYVGNWQKHYPSQSEADLAYITRMVEMSGLAREKTFKNLPRTVAKAGAILEADAAAIRHGQTIAENLLNDWKKKRRFRLLTDDDLLARPPLRWLVKGMVPASGVGSIFGPSQTYKSFVALDLLAHIASARPQWFEKKVKCAPCVYVPFEGKGGIPQRVAAWRDAHDGMSTNIRFIEDPINLRQQEDRDRLVETLDHNGWAGGVLCIDTLAAAAGMEFEENGSKDMGEMIAILNELQRRLGGIVLVVHHSGKDKTKGPRGHSSLAAALDFAVECERTELGPRFKIYKQKDGESGKEFYYQMQTRVLGLDEDGDDITSLSVIPDVPMPAKDPATKSAEDDDFIDAWIRKEVTAGNKPSKRSLERQLNDMKPERLMTRDGVRHAVDRLIKVGRLKEEKSGGQGAQAWLRPIDKAGP